MTEKKAKSRFWLGLVIYGLALLLLGGIVLYVYYGYLAAYEASRSSHCLEAYREGIAERLPEAGRAALSTLDTRIHSDKEYVQWAQTLLSDVRMPKIASVSSEERPVYAIKAQDGQQLGTVTLAITGQGDYGLPVWEVVDEQYDFSAYFETAGITVPAGYRVYLGDTLLGPEDQSESYIPFPILKECYERYEDLPYMVRYETGYYVDGLRLRVYDESDRELTEEELQTDRFLDNCSPEMRQEVEDYIDGFIDLYVRFSGNYHKSGSYYFRELKQVVTPGGQLYQRLAQAIGALDFVTVYGLEIPSITVNQVVDLGKGRYLADVTYVSEIVGLNGPVTATDSARIVLVECNGVLLADALFTY